MSLMRILVRLFLGVVFIAAIVLVAALLLGPKSKETWATVTAALAVIAAVIAAWPSLRILEIQEDATRPSPTPYFDLSSRYGLILLRVKNIGVGVAYDVSLNWEKHPLNEEGEEVKALDTISVLMPQDSVSILIGRSGELVKKYASMCFEDSVAFKDVAGKKHTQRFRCSANEHRKRLVHDEELPYTLYELQKLPKELAEIRKAIESFRDNG